MPCHLRSAGSQKGENPMNFKTYAVLGIMLLFLSGCCGPCGCGGYIEKKQSITQVNAQLISDTGIDSANLNYPTLLDLQQTQTPAKVLFLLRAQSEYSMAQSIFNFSVFSQAHACQPPPMPPFENSIASVRVFLNDSSIPGAALGIELTDQLVIVNSQDVSPKGLLLSQWNDRENKKQYATTKSTGIVTFAFLSPNEVVPDTVTYHIMVELDNGDLLETYTPAITFK
jgi:hypothetical protein